jgi:hypothetical protein
MRRPILPQSSDRIRGVGAATARVASIRATGAVAMTGAATTDKPGIHSSEFSAKPRAAAPQHLGPPHHPPRRASTPV